MAEKLQNFEGVVKFVKTYEWICNFKNTNFFELGVWERFPCQWLDILRQLSTEDLNRLPFQIQVNPKWPSSFNEFILNAQSFSIDRDTVCTQSLQMSVTETRGMNPKKRHEVEKLSSFVNNECERHNCGHIVDVGSGLGYVGQILSDRFGHHVVGLEREEDRVDGANNMKKTSQPNKQPNKLQESRAFTLEDSEMCYTQFDQLLNQIVKCPVPVNKQSDSVNRDTETDFEETNNTEAISSKREDSAGKCENTVGSSSSGSQTRLVNSHSENVCDACLTSCSDVGNTVASSNTCAKDVAVGSLRHDDLLKCSCQYSDCDVKKSHEKHERICMMGLHCCADLTPTMLKFFIRNERLKSLVCLGCCYHKMSYSLQDARWQQFPMSKQLSRVLEKQEAHDVFTPFTMRLAAQETRSRWSSQSHEDHEFHLKNVAYRGLLELFIKQEGISLQKTKRRVAGKSDYTDFTTYIEAVLKCFSFPGLKEEFIIRRLHELYDQYEEYFKYIEIFTCLQVIMQPVLESLIINDRVAYLREQGVQAQTVALFAQDISPRNIAIVASKIT